MADVTLTTGGAKATPLAYTLPGAQEIILKAVTASFNGAGAAGSFVPTLQIVAPNGAVILSCPVSTTLAAGASADVSWFPRGGLGGGAGGSPLDTTDGVTSVNPTSELLIGAGITLSNPSAGVAELLGSGFFPFYSVVAGVGGIPTFDIVGIPPSGKHLMILTNLRDDSPGVGSQGNVLLNGLSGVGVATYEYVDSFGNHGSNNGPVSTFPSLGAGADARHYAGGLCVIPAYSLSKTDIPMVQVGGGIGQVGNTGTWLIFSTLTQFCASDVAHTPIVVNRVTISPPAGATGFVQGSIVTLYILG